MVYISGENNVGKSTLFEAIDTLINGNEKTFIEKRNKMAENDKDTFINVEFSGDDIPEVISKYAQPNKIDVFQKYVFEEDGTYKFVISKSTNYNEKKLKLAELCIYDNKSKKFVNPSGISAPIKRLFKIINVSADDSADEEVNFRKNGTIGRLLAEITDTFSYSDEFKQLKKAHKLAFNSFEHNFSSAIDKRMTEILHNQYDNNVEAKINFNPPDVNQLVTNARLLVNDGIETDFYEKGNGLQRSIALALIQIQAEFEEKINRNEHKPVFYFVDEPEVFLHPRGQHKLRESLKKLSNNYQIFVATHSPFILDNYNKNEQDLCLLKKDIGGKISNKKINEMSNIFETPTCAEIIYYAFCLPTFDFHNQLYNMIQTHHKSVRKTDDDLYSYFKNNEKNYDNRLIAESASQSNEKPYKTLPTKIRNLFHHSEISNETISTEELEIAIKFMIDFCKKNIK